MIARVCEILRRFHTDARGIIAVEVAMAMPVILILILSGIDVTRYVLLHQKLERTAATMADLVSQSLAMSDAELNALAAAAEEVLDPYDLMADGGLVVSSIANGDGAGARVAWQRSFGSAADASRFGPQGGAATLPATFVVREGENAIGVEVMYDFVPIFAFSVLETGTIDSMALFRPRFANLTGISS